MSGLKNRNIKNYRDIWKVGWQEGVLGGGGGGDFMHASSES